MLIGGERPVARVHPLFDGLGVAGAELEGVVVLLAAVEHDHGRLVDVESVDLGLEDLGHLSADLFVVEAHVGVAARAAGVEPVVLDDLDSGFLGHVDDRRARARVVAREHDHLGAVGDGLLGLRLLGDRTAFGVDDVVVHAGLRERVLEVLAVVGLPPGRRCAVRKEHPDRAVALPSGCRRLGTGRVVRMPRRRRRNRPRRARGHRRRARLRATATSCRVEQRFEISSCSLPPCQVVSEESATGTIPNSGVKWKLRPQRAQRSRVPARARPRVREAAPLRPRRPPRGSPARAHTSSPTARRAARSSRRG